MYTKEFELRWSDIDANRHMANSAYLNLMSHTRTAFLKAHGFSLMTLSKAHLGPVVFYEHIYYYREAFLSEKIDVTLEVAGLSEDGMFFKFEHNFYNKKGRHLAHCEILGAWIDLNTRQFGVISLCQQVSKIQKVQNIDQRRY